MTDQQIVREADPGTGVWRTHAQAEAGGGSQPGAVRVLKYDFDYTQAPALATGVSFLTVADGDLLLDAWLYFADTWIFDGEVATGLCDFGVVDAGAFVSSGFFNRFSGAIDLYSANWSDGNVAAWMGYSQSTSTAPPALSTASVLVAVAGISARPPLVKFTAAVDLSVVVSSDGTPTGDAFDGSAGAATLYVAVCTPGDPS